MTDRDARAPTGLRVAVAVVLLGIAVRLVPLYWSPYPATLDGFEYAALAERTLATGRLPLPIAWDSVGFAAVVSVGSALTGLSPLWLAQPLAAVIGGCSCLVGVAVAHRVGTDLGWPAGRVRLAAALAGLGLAVEGLYVRRTGVPDEEVVGLLLVPLLALAVHLALERRHLGWGALAGLFALVFPPLHVLGTLVALLTVTAVAVVHLTRGPSRRSAAAAVAGVAGFWLYLFEYYRFARLVSYLELTYVDRILGAPGLLVAWLVLLVFGAGWALRTTDRRAALGVLLVVGAWFGLLGANALRPVFPGTATTRPALLLLAVPLAVAVALAGHGLALSRRTPGGGLLLALLAGPVVLVWFALTAGLTADYFGTAIRAQTFAHVAVLTAAGIGAARIGRPDAGAGWRPARGAVVAGLLVALAVSAPLSVVALDTMSYPSVTTRAEFETAEFGATQFDAWATDDPIQRVANLYHGARSVETEPVAAWVRDGVAPTCPTAARRAWTTSGASLYPVPPGRIGAEAYREWVAERNRVYSVDGGAFVVTMARNGTVEAGC